MIHFKRFLYLPLFLQLVCTKQPFAQSDKPNILYFLVDDLGYADCGFNGGKDILTPQIDRLARDGSILNYHYVQPVCSPSRAALLTGRYPTKTGIYTVIKPGDPKGLPLEEKTLAQALKENGYYTALLGKWHLGDADSRYLPMARGFDYHYGHYTGNIDYFEHTRNSRPDWFRNGHPIKEEGYSTNLITKETCELLGKIPSQQPFFLLVSFNGIHAPLQAPEKYLKAYSHLSGDRKTLAGMLAAVDEGVGQIMEALYKSGKSKETLVIFSSDNGGPPPGNNAPLRDFKGSVYEGGIRGAAFVHWPGKIPAGATFSEPMHITDWYPTLLSAVGGPLQQPNTLDGSNLWPVLTGKKTSAQKPILVVSNKGPELAALILGEWKLIYNKSEATVVEEVQSNKKKRYEPLALFNLKDDPGETTNLANHAPEKMTQLQRFLMQLLNGAVKD